MIFNAEVNESIGVFFGLISVYLTVKENIWCWPTGILNVFFFAMMFYQSKLYSESILQVIFFILILYGWWSWLFGGKNKTELHITHTENIWLMGIILGSGISAGITGYLMGNNTDASLPYIDSAILMFSISAQALQARKKIESWLFWIGVDIVSIGVYLYKGLNKTAVLYCVFLYLATRGYLLWRKKILRTEPA